MMCFWGVGRCQDSESNLRARCFLDIFRQEDVFLFHTECTEYTEKVSLGNSLFCFAKLLCGMHGLPSAFVF